jgi:5-methylcytosine-specific restriction endonuclease McrA
MGHMGSAAVAIDGQTKPCRVCRRDLPLARFHAKLRGRFGVDTICSECSAREKGRYRQGFAILNEGLRMIEEVPNPDGLKLCRDCGEYLQRRAFYISIGEKDGLQKYCMACIRRRNSTYVFNRRSRDAGCIGAISRAEWDSMLAIQDDCCARCEVKLAEYIRCLDHIVSAGPGVSSRPSNLQFLCRGCNARKQMRTTDYRKPEWLKVWPPD